jgi:transposase
MHTVGADVHVRNSYLDVTTDEGQALRRGRCPNSLADLAEFLAGIDPAEGFHVVIESTTNSRAIARMWQEYGQQAGVAVQADVVNARKVRIIAESVCKTDRLDAQVLSELGRSNLRLPVCYVPDDEVFALREHLRARQDLVQIRTMLKNRVHAVLHRRGILTPEQDLFGKAGQEWLGQIELDEAGRQIVSRFQEGLATIERTIAESTAMLRRIARQDRWSKQAALLQTIPGVGLITSLTMLAELGDLSRFASRAAVTNFVGLIPVTRLSNDHGFQGRITRRGSRHLRAVLVEAAWVAIRRVPRYQALFERIKQRKHACTAIVAVARQILEDGFTILRKGESFRFESRRVVASVPG